MTEREIIERVKEMRHFGAGNQHDNFLRGWIQAAKADMALCGVSDEAIESERSVGAIVQYLLDLDDRGEVSNGTYGLIMKLALTYPRKGGNNV